MKLVKVSCFHDEIPSTTDHFTALCDIIERVPYGVLVFMPSYKALDVFTSRWNVCTLALCVCVIRILIFA